MAIKAVTNLEDHLSRQKERDNIWERENYREIVFENCLVSLCRHPKKIDPCDVLALDHFRYSIDHLSIILSFKFNALELCKSCDLKLFIYQDMT